MESNHLPVAYQATARPESLAATMEPGSRLELLCHPYQGCGSPSILARLKTWIPAADLNRALLSTKQVRRPLRLQGMEPIPGLEPGFLDYKSSTSPPTLDRLKTSPASYHQTNQNRSPGAGSSPHLRQLGAGYRTRTDVDRLAACRPGRWTKPA